MHSQTLVVCIALLQEVLRKRLVSVIRPAMASGWPSEVDPSGAGNPTRDNYAVNDPGWMARSIPANLAPAIGYTDNPARRAANALAPR